MSLRIPFSLASLGYSGSGVPAGVMYFRPPPRITWRGRDRHSAHSDVRGGEGDLPLLALHGWALTWMSTLCTSCQAMSLQP